MMAVRQGRLWPGQGRSVRDGPSFSNPGQFMAALIAIGVFIAAIFVLNIIEFGRPD
jgi:hypothetical protein